CERRAGCVSCPISQMGLRPERTRAMGGARLLLAIHTSALTPRHEATQHNGGRAVMSFTRGNRGSDRASCHREVLLERSHEGCEVLWITKSASRNDLSRNRRQIEIAIFFRRFDMMQPGPGIAYLAGG